MGLKLNRYLLPLYAVACLTACNNDIDFNADEPVPDKAQDDIVLMSVNNEEQLVTVTRAGNLVTMPKDKNIRFTAMMLYNAANSTSNNYLIPNAEFANLRVGQLYQEGTQPGEKDWNSLYVDDHFTAITSEDAHHNDSRDVAHKFRWQNRKQHAFIGFINDYNQVSESSYVPFNINSWNTTAPEVATAGMQLIKTNEGIITDWQQYVEYDLTTQGKDYMTEQPDPLVACEEVSPLRNSAEENRVKMVFRHQFAQIQVNLKQHEDMASDFITAERIHSVDLLGVSEKAYVYPFPQYKKDDQDNVQIVRQDQKLLRPAYGVPPSLSQYMEKKCGTEIRMFTKGTAETDYLKSFEAIAFGTLDSLRIKWVETEQNGSVEHTIAFPISDDDFKNLKSGNKYIFNLELRLGTLAVINTKIDDWEPYDKDYQGPNNPYPQGGRPEYVTDGKIDKTPTSTP